MPKYRVLIARPVGNGSHRAEVGNFIVRATEDMNRNPDIHPLIDEYFHVPVQRFPTHVARNTLVETARKLNVDFMFMVDDDASPNLDFFEYAFHFLRQSPVPCIIAAPHCCAPPEEEVQVFEMTHKESQAPLQVWALSRIPREDACLRQGTQRVASVSTHCVAYDMRVFDKIQRPYYNYQYEDDSMCKVIETEDCWCHRHLFNAGVPIYVTWDHWAGHYKLKNVERPVKLSLDQIPDYFLEKATARLKYEQMEYPTIPKDVEGWTDYGHLYAEQIKSLPPGSTFVEVGTWMGKSIIHAGQQARLHNKPINFICVDTFKGDPNEPYCVERVKQLGGSTLPTFLKNLERYELSKSIQYLESDSVSAAKAFPDNSVDFLFIDASHDYESVRDDIAAWYPKVKLGGIIAGHDYANEFQGVIRAVKEAFPEGYEVRYRSWLYKKPLYETHQEVPEIKHPECEYQDICLDCKTVSVPKLEQPL